MPGEAVGDGFAVAVGRGVGDAVGAGDGVAVPGPTQTVFEFLREHSHREKQSSPAKTPFVQHQPGRLSRHGASGSTAGDGEAVGALEGLGVGVRVGFGDGPQDGPTHVVPGAFLPQAQLLKHSSPKNRPSVQHHPGSRRVHGPSESAGVGVATGTVAAHKNLVCLPLGRH